MECLYLNDYEIHQINHIHLFSGQMFNYDMFYFIFSFGTTKIFESIDETENRLVQWHRILSANAHTLELQ